MNRRARRRSTSTSIASPPRLIDRRRLLAPIALPLESIRRIETNGAGGPRSAKTGRFIQRPALDIPPNRGGSCGAFLSLDPSHGDVKDIWEPARFTWVFDLILGYAVSRDERYAEAFWSGVDSFVDGNPPFRGIQWSCGQETSIRALSCLWAERVFARTGAATSSRRARLRDLFAWSGERVANAIEYAISQRNNHGISEATGLVALGHRLAGVHPDAADWLRDGARWIEYLVMDQFGEDGWYIQHSLNYLRMALDQLVVAERVLVAARGHGLSEQARARIHAAIALLVELCDAQTGDVPNHGANDGSMVLPMTTRPYRDFRPAITAAAATFGASLPHNFDASMEALAWLGVESVSRRDDAAATSVVTGSSGWASARVGRARVFARAGIYESNPSHIDPAHIDIWIDGEPRSGRCRNVSLHRRPRRGVTDSRRSPCTTRSTSHRFLQRRRVRAFSGSSVRRQA